MYKSTWSTRILTRVLGREYYNGHPGPDSTAPLDKKVINPLFTTAQARQNRPKVQKTQ